MTEKLEPWQECNVNLCHRNRACTYMPCWRTRPTPDVPDDVVEAMAEHMAPWLRQRFGEKTDNIHHWEAVACDMLDDTPAYAAAEEAWTKRVVEWLRDGGHLGKRSVLKPALANAANAIERREHLKENPNV